MKQTGMQQASQAVPMAENKTNILQIRRFISGSTLKMIAVITMLIDHFAAGVLGRYLYMNGGNDLDWTDMAAYEQWMAQNEKLYRMYNIMRDIGRVAFPIYCFLLVEGFMHTKDRKKYTLRIFLFALISEIPFDLLFGGKILEPGYQNVFFTLFFGMLAMTGMDWAEKRRDIPAALKLILMCAAAFVCMEAAKLALTDYGLDGVLCIVIMYLFRSNRELQIAAGSCSFLLFLNEMAAPYAFLSIALYNGKRGWKLKYFFYLFYPVHLLCLYLLCMALGISSYPVW